MLKITADRDARRLVLEGSLAGPWVDTLEQSWREACACGSANTITIDLSEVTFVDARGKQLLGSIHRAGAILSAHGMNASMIQDIVSAATASRAEPRRARTSVLIAAGLLGSSLLLAQCSRTDPAAGGGSAAPAAGKPPVAVDVTPVVAGALTRTIDVVGSLAPKFTAEIKSEVTGTVTAVYVTEWVPVKAGDRLAQLNTSENDATLEAVRAAEAQARVVETRARREYDRALQLKEFGLITAQAVDDARTAVDAAQAATAGARAQVRAAEARLAKAFITAPIDGVIAMRGVNVGDRVENMGGNGPMFRIVDNRVLDLTVSVPSAQLGDVRVGLPLEFTVDALPGRTFTGQVMFINPSVDEASRAARVIAEVRNTDGALKGGLFANGRILAGSRENALQIPQAALANWDVVKGEAQVFVICDGAADQRTVRTGAVAGTHVAVMSGLSAGELVVTRGGFALKPGDRVAVAAGQGK